MIKSGHTLSKAALGLIAAMMVGVAPMAHAEPEMGMGHHDMEMGMGHHEMEMGPHGMGGSHEWGHHGMGGCMHGMGPHNAAEHFLKMGHGLGLNDEQTKQIRKLRDDYIAKHAAAEEQLKAAKSDLNEAIYADDMDMAKVNALLDQVGKLDAELWHAYAEQLKSIKGVLTDKQKQELHKMWDHHEGEHPDMMPHHGMDMAPGPMMR